MEGSIFCVVASWLVCLISGVHGDFCEHTWVLYDNICFKFFDENIVQAETKKECEARGARRLTVLTPEYKNTLVHHIKNGNSSYWCDIPTGEIDSRLLPNVSTVSPHPLITSPRPVITPRTAITSPRPVITSPHTVITSPTTMSSTVKKVKSCYYLQDMELRKGDCNVPRGFLCEKDSIVLPGTCPEGTDKIGPNCFWRTSALLNKTQAEDTCSIQGGWLAILGTRRQRSYGIATVALRKKKLWVDGKKEEGKIKWGNGKVLDPAQERTFISTQDEGGECVILGVSDVSESGTAWIFGDCGRTAYGLCEKEAVLTVPAINTTTVIPDTTPEPTCPGVSSRDREKDGMCYWETTYETPRFDWDNARKYCQSYGGDLASYKDAAEEQITLGSTRGLEYGLWTGLRRDPGSHVFRWSDGTPLTYTNWAPGQPKLKGNVKLCVAHTGKNSTWEEMYCGVRRWFACKIPKATIPSSPIRPTAAPLLECEKIEGSHVIPWYYHQGHCYVFYLTQSFSWDTAKRFCQDNGAFLPSIHSYDEIKFLLQLSPDYGHELERSFWIGLRAKGLYSPYRWDDGTPFDFVNWDEDDDYDYGSNTDTCVSFDTSTGTWKKNHCSLLEYVICKRQNGTNHQFSTAAPTASLPGYCPDGWYTLGNKCYNVFGIRHKSTWDEASTKCAEIGSQLVSIHSQEEQNFLTLLTLSTESDTWIGMYSTIGGRLFHWTDNSSIDYTNWDSYEPSYANEKEECVHLVFSPNVGKMGKWNDHQCSMRFPFICQIPKDPMLTKPGRDGFLCTKPEGWIKLGSSCYQIFDVSDNRLTWLQAQSYCMSLQANLASIKNFAISGQLRHYLNRSTSVFWIGMRDMNQDNYRWVGSSSPLAYTNWLQDQPRRVSPIHNCVAVDRDGKWMVRNCDESHPFICEESKEAPTLAPESPDLVCPNTTNKWKEFGGKYCYIIETSKHETWYHAAHYCFMKGGHLASIHSEQELELILHHIKDSKLPVHIGLGQKEDGSFGWFDGSAVDYEKWAPGEPNAASEMCVEMHTDIGTWNDVKCSEKRGYVCSTMKVPRNVSTTSALTDKGKDLERKVNAGGIAGIIICVLVVLSIMAVAFYYFCPSTSMRARRQTDSTRL